MVAIPVTLADLPDPGTQMAAVVLSLAAAQGLPLALCAQAMGRSPESAAALLALYAEAIPGTLRELGFPDTVAAAFPPVVLPNAGTDRGPAPINDHKPDLHHHHAETRDMPPTDSPPPAPPRIGFPQTTCAPPLAWIQARMDGQSFAEIGGKHGIAPEAVRLAIADLVGEIVVDLQQP